MRVACRGVSQKLRKPASEMGTFTQCMPDARCTSCSVFRRQIADSHEGIGRGFCIFHQRRSTRRLAAEMFSSLFESALDSTMKKVFSPMQRMMDQHNQEAAARALEQKEEADHKCELQEMQGLQTVADRLQADPMSIILEAKVCPLSCFF